MFVKAVYIALPDLSIILTLANEKKEHAYI